MRSALRGLGLGTGPRHVIPQNAVVYPDSGPADALHASARTIRADVSAEIITVDHCTWYHHAWIGKPDTGFYKVLRSSRNWRPSLSKSNEKEE